MSEQLHGCCDHGVGCIRGAQVAWYIDQSRFGSQAGAQLSKQRIDFVSCAVLISIMWAVVVKGD